MGLFSLSCAHDKTKKHLSLFFTELKTCIPSYSIYKHDAIHIADPSSMQDAYHMNFVIDLAHRSLCGSVVKHWSAKFKDLRFDSLWVIRFFEQCARSICNLHSRYNFAPVNTHLGEQEGDI